MKIGIITIHNSTNYGACLQSWGLYKFLTDEGYDCEIIDLHRPVHTDYIISKKYKAYRKHPKTLIRRIKDFVKSYIPNKTPQYELEKNKKFENFNKHICLSRAYCSIDDLYENPPLYDVYISGSDQLWNPSQPFCIEPYFLTFVNTPNAKKISYASSIGLSKLQDNETKDFSKWLSDYNAISVREQEAKELLNKLISNNVEVVADPTFLLKPDYWHSIAKRPNIKEPYILVFKLNRAEIVEYAINLGKQSGKRVIVLPNSDDMEGCTILRNQGLEEYLGWFANADLVISDSFHATVFSIQMGAKNFFSYIHPTNMRGSRIRTLLRNFDIENHLLEPDLSQSYECLCKLRIDKDKLYQICISQMEEGRNYLRQNLR